MAHICEPAVTPVSAPLVAKVTGTGRTLSSAIAASYARSTTSDPELRLKEAVGAAKGWLTGSLTQADRLDIGHGIGPVHHSYLQWPLIDGASRPVGGQR